MGEFVERDLGNRSPWNPKPKNINSGNESAEEKRKQNRDRIASQQETPVSSLGRVNNNIGQHEALEPDKINDRPKRGTRGKGRTINYK